jgi:hypothetical protein
MDSSTYMGRNSDAVIEIQQRVERELKRYSNKKDIKISDPNEITQTEYSPQSTGTNILPTRSQLNKNYDDLVYTKIKDKNMRMKAIDYAELMIQPTTFCKLELHSNKGKSAELKIICCLPEHAQAFANFWVGKTIDSNQFKTIVSKFEGEMKKYLISNVIIEEAPRTECRITEIKSTFTFA